MALGYQAAEDYSVEVVMAGKIQSVMKIYTIECPCYSLSAQTPPLITTP